MDPLGLGPRLPQL